MGKKPYSEGGYAHLRSVKSHLGLAGEVDPPFDSDRLTKIGIHNNNRK